MALAFKNMALGGFVNEKQPSRFQPTSVPRETSVGPRLKRLERFSSKFVRRGGIPVLELPARSVFSTYTLDSEPLSATDAGSSATINVATFKVFWPDKPDGIQYRPFSLTGLAYSTDFRAYIDNPERNGVVDHCHRGAIPTSGTPQNIVARQDTEGRIYLGIITTPAAAAGDTSGSGGGKGALATTSAWDTEVRGRPVPLVDGRVGNAIDANLFYNTQKYHDSAIREPTTLSRNGQTSNGSWTTVAQYNIEASKSPNFQAPVTITKIAGGAGSFGPETSLTEVNDSTRGTINWTSLSNVRASDNARAAATLAGVEETRYLKATNFGFSIPSDHSILGIEVKVERREANILGGAKVRDGSVKIVKGGSISGNEKKKVGEWPTPNDAVATYGGSSDLWGLSWLFSDINLSTFGIAVSAKEFNLGTTISAQIDQITITVHTDGGTYTMKGRIKIGAKLSSELSFSKPSTTANGTLSISDAGTGTLTVEVQAILSAGSGTVENDLTQKRYTDQHKEHFT
jgi:hypothetical protein